MTRPSPNLLERERERERERYEGQCVILISKGIHTHGEYTPKKMKPRRIHNYAQDKAHTHTHTHTHTLQLPKMTEK